MNALFFDTETTGVKSWKDPGFVPRLVQLGAILQDLDSGRILAEVNLMVHPEGVEIPAGAARVHGISTELATDAGVPMRMVDEIFGNLVDKAQLIVAHNAKYDLEVVADNLNAAALIISGKPVFCTMESSRYIVRAPLSEKQVAYFRDHPEKRDHPFKSPNLTETFKHFFGVPFEGAHDAMADIRACRDIFGQLRQQGYYLLDGGRVLETAKVVELRRET